MARSSAGNIRTAQEAGFGTVLPDVGPNVAVREQSLNIPDGGLEGSYGRSARVLGEAGMRAANALEAQAKENDVLVASQLDEAFQREVMQASYDPDKGFFAQKGLNAVGLQKTAEQQLQEIRAKYQVQAGNDRVSALFDRSSSKTLMSTMESVNRYSMGQTAAYRDERADSTIKLGAEKIAMNPKNDPEFKQSLSEMQSAALAKNKDKSPEGVNLALYEAGSLAYSTRASQLMQSENPQDIERGAKLYEQARQDGELTFEHSQKLDSLRDAALPKALAQRGLQEIRAGSSFASADADTIFDNGLVKQESGGRQFDANGQPLTSSAGAVGAAQVMKGTGPEAAAAAGLPWDEERWKNDKAYNLAIGKAYFKKQVNAFNDKTLGTLAYNWGPGSVLEHIARVGDPRKGEITMSEFLSTVPSKEAREYVGRVQGRMGTAGSTPDIGLVTAKAAELDAIHPGAGATFLSAYKAERQVLADAKKDYNAQITEKIGAQLAASNGDISKVDSNLRAQAMQAGIWDEASKFSGRTDTSALYDLRDMPPEEFAQVDLRTYATKLSQDDLLKEQTRQQALRKGDEAYKDFSSKVDNYYMRMNGNSSVDKGQKASFAIRADQAFYAFQKANNRGPNNDEARSILQSLTLKADSSSDAGGRRVFNFQPAEKYKVEGAQTQEVPYYSQILTDNGYDISNDNLETARSNPIKIIGPVQDVPDEVANRIIPQLIKNGTRVTPNNIRAAYQLAKRDEAIQNKDWSLMYSPANLGRIAPNPALGNVNGG